MKKAIFILAMSLFFAATADASEIFGQISTNPNYTTPPENSPAPVLPSSSAVSSSGTSPESEEEESLTEVEVEKIASSSLPEPEEKSEPVAEKQIAPEVLSTKIYQDGTLLRDADGKIFLVQGQYKKHIINLKELTRYRGREILSATGEELAGYQNRAHVYGELIRQKGDVKVYEIIKGGKHHVLNLKELRAYYFGQEIFNVDAEEMIFY